MLVCILVVAPEVTILLRFAQIWYVSLDFLIIDKYDNEKMVR